MSGSLRVESITVRRVRLPLHRPLEAAHGTLADRPLVFVHVITAEGDGWGECAALPDATYTEEDLDGAAAFIEGTLAPAVIAGQPVDGLGHPMATAAVTSALLDADLRAAGRSLARHLGVERDRVLAGAVLGLQPSPDAAATAALSLSSLGYRRLRLKIAPGRDTDVLGAVRDAVGPRVQLLADANTSYAAFDIGEVVDRLRPLEALDLIALEQPFAAEDIERHAELAARLDVRLGLDESITSLDELHRILDLGVVRVACIKPAHLGGLDEAGRAEALCRAAGVDAFVGGMFDSAYARSANAALAALPGFTIPGDVGPPSTYLAADVAPYPSLGSDGTVTVWDGPGLGPRPRLDG